MDHLREPAKDHSEEKSHAMALDQSALPISCSGGPTSGSDAGV